MISAGIFEEMFNGVGMEYLYFPETKNFAVGFELFEVHKRDYKLQFGTLDYKNTSGHINFYHRNYKFIPFDTKISYGEYLAGDKGYTFDLSRRFNNGVVMGGFFTRTDVTAEQFGEGSFDKGLYFRVPFNAFAARNTRTAFKTIVRPLERDGGRRLEDFGQTLWTDRRSIRLDALSDNKDRMYN